MSHGEDEWNAHFVLLGFQLLTSRRVGCKYEAGKFLYKVVYTGEGSDEILGSYLHFRMDMLHHNTEGQDAAEVHRLLQQLDSANSVSRAVHLPIGEIGLLKSVETLLGFVPTCMKTASAGGQRQLTLFTTDFRSRFEGRDSARLYLDTLNVPGVLDGGLLPPSGTSLNQGQLSSANSKL
jgi:hypothetical protein